MHLFQWRVIWYMLAKEDAVGGNTDSGVMMCVRCIVHFQMTKKWLQAAKIWKRWTDDVYCPVRDDTKNDFRWWQYRQWSIDEENCIFPDDKESGCRRWQFVQRSIDEVYCTFPDNKEGGCRWWQLVQWSIDEMYCSFPDDYEIGGRR